MNAENEDTGGRSGLLLRFREVTEEIDAAPARLRALGARRRELARQLVQVYGWPAAAELTGLGPPVLIALALEGAES